LVERRAHRLGWSTADRHCPDLLRWQRSICRRRKRNPLTGWIKGGIGATTNISQQTLV
jgi:hypothetical protein